MATETNINISEDLVASAQAFLDRTPNTPEEVIEHWAILGKKLAGEMTETQMLAFLSGRLTVKLIENNRTNQPCAV